MAHRFFHLTWPSGLAPRRPRLVSARLASGLLSGIPPPSPLPCTHRRRHNEYARHPVVHVVTRVVPFCVAEPLIAARCACDWLDGIDPSAYIAAWMPLHIFFHKAFPLAGRTGHGFLRHYTRDLVPPN